MYSCDDTLAGGLPHSDIHGSTPARGSPWLFAACHVLHRLLVPRHPPNALIILRSSCQRSVQWANDRMISDPSSHPHARSDRRNGTRGEPRSSPGSFHADLNHFGTEPRLL